MTKKIVFEEIGYDLSIVRENNDKIISRL
jgi:hypothetical protein